MRNEVRQWGQVTLEGVMFTGYLVLELRFLLDQSTRAESSLTGDEAIVAESGDGARQAHFCQGRRFPESMAQPSKVIGSSMVNHCS